MIYAIGDIHGQAEMLDHALGLIDADGGPDAEVVFLGDYTDRGLQSAKVLDRLIEGRDAGRNWTFVKGNHDRSFWRFVNDGRMHDPRVSSGINWLNARLGGTNTLAAYGIIGTPVFAEHRLGTQEILLYFETDAGLLTSEQVQTLARQAVPSAHLDFLESLPLWHETPELLFVHAGLVPGVPLAQQAEDDLIWIRAPFLEDTSDHGKLVVHGHTALDHPAHCGNRVNLDGGAGYGRPLIPAAFDGREAWLLTETGRQPLVPR